MSNLSGARLTLRISSNQMEKMLELLQLRNYKSVSDLVRQAIEDLLVAEGLITR